jgi:hypothetical protein
VNACNALEYVIPSNNLTVALFNLKIGGLPDSDSLPFGRSEESYLEPNHCLLDANASNEFTTFDIP